MACGGLAVLIFKTKDFLQCEATECPLNTKAVYFAYHQLYVLLAQVLIPNYSDFLFQIFLHA